MAVPYAASQITGTIGVEDTVTGKDMRDVSDIFYKFSNNELAPFFAILSSIKKGKPAYNTKIEWYKKDIFPHWDRVATGFSAAATPTVVVTNADYFKVGDLVEFPDADVGTSETNKAYVTAKTTTSLTLDAVHATYTNVCDVLDGEWIHNLSDASEEYSQAPSRKVVKDVADDNYIQFLRVPYAVGNLAADRKQYTGPERPERKSETFDEIRMQFEKVIMFGEKGYIDGTDGRAFFCQGLKTKILEDDGDNILDWSAGLTENQLDEFLVEGPLKFGSNRRILFASAELFLKFAEIAKAKEQIINGSQVKKLGMALYEYLAPNGKTIYIKQHHMLENSYEAAGLMVDLDYVKIRPYGSQGSFQFHEGIQENDRAGFMDEWRIIASLEVGRTHPHAWFHK